MARRRKAPAQPGLSDFRHDEAKRKNNPPAKIAGEGTVPAIPKAQYTYSPRLPPVLRFYPDGAPDRLSDLLAEAGRRPLTAEQQRFAAAARQDLQRTRLTRVIFRNA